MKEANMQETSPSLPGRACVAKSTEGEGGGRKEPMERLTFKIKGCLTVY